MLYLQQVLKQPHFRSVDAVIYQSDHFVGQLNDDRDRAVWATALRPGRPPALGAFIDEFGDNHAEALKAVAGPFHFHDKTSDKSALNGLTARQQGPAGA